MKKFFSIVGMLFGLAIIVSGIMIAVSTYGGERSFQVYMSEFANDTTERFQADEYNATVNAVKNIYYIGDLMENLCIVGGIVVALAGGVVFCGFGYKLADDAAKKKEQQKQFSQLNNISSISPNSAPNYVNIEPSNAGYICGACKAELKTFSKFCPYCAAPSSEFVMKN